jgi:hypothetical protein
MRFPSLSAVAAAAFILTLIPFAARAASPTACTLLSAQTAASLLGVPVGDPMDMRGVVCVYSPNSGDGLVQLALSGGGPMSEKDFMGLGANAKGPSGTIESISDFGEPSFFVLKPSSENILAVLHHQRQVTFTVQRKMTPALKAQMIQAMKQILAKF